MTALGVRTVSQYTFQGPKRKTVEQRRYRDRLTEEQKELIRKKDAESKRLKRQRKKVIDPRTRCLGQEMQRLSFFPGANEKGVHQHRSQGHTCEFFNCFFLIVFFWTS